ncbi:hypothetical protein OY671_011315, partial [Metschnikowia pulcherrima]
HPRHGRAQGGAARQAGARPRGALRGRPGGAARHRRAEPHRARRRDRRHRGRVGQRAVGAGRGLVRAAAAAGWADHHPRPAIRADPRSLRQIQGIWIAGRAAAQRQRAAHDGGREHGSSRLRQAADERRSVAHARPYAGAGARAHQGLSREDHVTRKSDREPVGR